MERTGWEGKKVFIRTRHGKVYSGTIKGIIQDSEWSYVIQLKDKFGKSVMLRNDEIAEMKEE